MLFRHAQNQADSPRRVKSRDEIELSEAALEVIRANVAAAPPLSDETKDKLRQIFGAQA
jgi:hypothetical protein